MRFFLFAYVRFVLFMHPLRISQSILKTIDNNKNTFKFILNGLENGAITKSKQKEIGAFFTNLIFILIL